MSLQVPGKTFLVGEYAVLSGGSALVLATKPFFKQTSVQKKYHPESPVARFLQTTDFWAVENDYGVGGFGQSSAEFIMAWISQNPESMSQGVFTKDCIGQIFRDYRKLYTSDLSQQPSGADVVGQCLGPITWFRPVVEQSSTYEWPFRNLGFFLVATGYKQPTHEHLDQLDRTLLKDLVPISEETIHSFFKSDSHFIASLNHWSHNLDRLGLLCDFSRSLKNELMRNPLVLCAKPCGAMGADVILVAFEVNHREEVEKYLNTKSLKIKASDLSLTKLYKE